MNNLKIYWEKFILALNTLVSKIEESALFERIVLKIESLEPRQQKAWRLGGFLAGVFVFLGIFLLPLFMVLREKWELSETRDMVNELQSFNSENSVVKRPAPRPQGWQGMPAANITEIESSLEQFSETIGVPPDFIDLKATPPGDLSINIKELSLRQAVAIIFQVDGWHPGLDFESLRVSVNPDAKDLLSLNARLRYDESQISQDARPSGAQGGSGSNSMGGGYTRLDDSGPAPLDAPPTSEREQFRPARPGTPESNFPDEDYMPTEPPPPPLNFEDDL